MIKRIYLVFAIIGVIAISLLLGWILGKKSQLFTNKESITASVVVEKMEKVMKLATIEATLSEIYKYADYYSFDISFFRKKALLRVSAKVLAGYDMGKLKFTLDTINRKVIIEGIPDAEILSIDHTLDYYDIDEGFFNSFDPKTYNHINANAKEYIRKVALKSEILKEARDKKDEMIEMWAAVLTGIGYEVEVKTLSSPILLK